MSRGFYLPTSLALGVIICSAVLPVAGVGAAPSRYEAFKAKACAPFQSDYERVVADHPKEPALLALKSRMDVIEEVAQLVAEQMESERASLAEKLAGDIAAGVTAKAPAAPTQQGAPASVVMAADLIREHEPDFAAALPRPEVSDAEREAVVGYYNATLQAAKAFAEARGEAAAALGGQSRDNAIRLTLVLPFLTQLDQRWSAADVEALPAWLRSREGMNSCESFALSMGRPYAAYQFAAARQRALPPPVPPPPFPVYLRESAGRLVALREYTPAIHCLRVAAKEADTANDVTAAAAVRVRLAELFEAVNRTQLAAEEMKATLALAGLSTTDYGRCAMLRLKYLYAAGQVDAVANEAPVYAGDERSKPYLPQILYIQWVTLRRRGDQEGAKRVGEAFLRQFPDHELGAEFHFADAMAALAETRYDEALRSLDLIETRYPNSKLLPKVKEIREKVQAGDAAQRR
jgi:hypothetical protein